MDKIYIGTELKFKLEITAEGFSMDDDDFEVDLKCGNKTVHKAKSDCVHGPDGWYVCFGSSELGVGKIFAVVTAHVPDADFPDNIRDEVSKVMIATIISL